MAKNDIPRNEKVGADISALRVDVVTPTFPLATVVPYSAKIDAENRTLLAASGWLVCDGAAISRTKYAKLYQVMGDIHGRGDATTTFNLPDYRGRFLRGVDSGAGRDPDASRRIAASAGGLTGDNVGSVQSDDVRSHDHDTVQMIYDNNVDGVDSATTHSDEHHNESRRTGAWGGNETRPINANVYWLLLAGKAL